MAERVGDCPIVFRILLSCNELPVNALSPICCVFPGLAFLFRCFPSFAGFQAFVGTGSGTDESRHDDGPTRQVGCAAILTGSSSCGGAALATEHCFGSFCLVPLYSNAARMVFAVSLDVST